MKKEQPKQVRTLAISLSSRGFGYAVMERESRIVGYGNTVVKKNKNARVRLHIERIINRYQPDVLALHNVGARGTYRHRRIKELHKQVVALAGKCKVRVVKFSNAELRNAMLGNEHGTKHEMAELLAKRFPDELASRLPAKRKDWTSEDAHMDIFDAVGLVTALQAPASGQNLFHEFDERLVLKTA